MEEWLRKWCEGKSFDEKHCGDMELDSVRK